MLFGINDKFKNNPKVELQVVKKFFHNNDCSSNFDIGKLFFSSLSKVFFIYCLDLSSFLIGWIPIWRMRPKLISKILITPIVILVKRKSWDGDTSCQESPHDQNNIEKGIWRNPITSSRNNCSRHSGEKNQDSM